MNRPNLLLAAGATARLIATSACGSADDTRSAEAETPVSEAEITTELPAEAISDEELQATANAAADDAATVPSAGPGRNEAQQETLGNGGVQSGDPAAQQGQAR